MSRGVRLGTSSAPVVTIAERKALAVAKLEAGGCAVMNELRTYAIVHGIRFRVFGSFARGQLTPDSDFDVVVEGPEPAQRLARLAAEAACRRHGLRADVLLAEEVTPALMLRIDRDGVNLP